MNILIRIVEKVYRIYVNLTFQVCEETLAAHRERVGELRALVSRIAADVGLEAAEPLKGELDALGRRLEDVRAALTSLARAAEGRHARRADLRRAAKALTDLTQVSPFVFEIRNFFRLSPLEGDNAIK